MKILPLLLLLTTLPLTAQTDRGAITYLVTEEILLPESEDPEEAQRDKAIRAALDQMRASGAFDKHFRTTFSPEAFSCQELPKAYQEQTREMGGVEVTIMNEQGPTEHYFVDLKDGSVTNARNLTDRLFLINDRPAPLAWVPLEEDIAAVTATGMDLEYLTTTNAAGDSIVAGYAPALPVQAGPRNYYGAPGAILYLKVIRDNSATVYSAEKIELGVAAGAVERPTEGKRISKEKFVKEQRRVREANERTVRVMRQ